jgi:hypothetical protein
MSHLRTRRLLSRLALLAMLFLATLPTLGRMAQAAHPAAQGLQMAGHAMPMAHDRMPPERAPPPHDHGEDCAYCVLLSGAIPTAPLSPVVALAPAWGFVGLPPRAGPVAESLRPGLGARGPPGIS